MKSQNVDSDYKILMYDFIHEFIERMRGVIEYTIGWDIGDKYHHSFDFILYLNNLYISGCFVLTGHEFIILYLNTNNKYIKTLIPISFPVEGFGYVFDISDPDFNFNKIFNIIINDANYF